MQKMISYSFKGRYTLREINNIWYIYDREKGTTTERLHSATFKKAQEELYKYKKEKKDEEE